MSQEVVALAGRYLLEEPIAKGGMATVWRARDEVLARPVAVKILREDLAEDSAFVARFKREALAAARLTHPAVVAIYDTGEEEIGDNTVHYIVMEYCGRGTVGDLMGAGGLDPDQVVEIGVAICEALDYAHRHGVIHRDVKPANVLISDTGAIKVGDFGIAKAAFETGSDVTTTGSILGTVTYLSPEQAQGVEPDARSDLYSLGVLLFEALAGRPPFEEETQIATAMRHLHDDPPRLRGISANVPKRLEAVVMKALAKDPADRYGSAKEMAAALQGDTRQTTPVSPHNTVLSPEPAVEQEAPASTGSDLRWVAPVLAVVAIAALLVWLVTSLISNPSGSTGNPGGGGSSGGHSSSATHPLAVTGGTSFDPQGDGTEHPEDVHLAYDGNPSTSWTTEDYQAPLSLLGKDGVGIVLDLGSPKKVARVQITGSTGMGVELRAADSKESSADSYQLVDSISSAPGTWSVTAGKTARYWLVWITDLPGGEGGTASVSEVRFFGS